MMLFGDRPPDIKQVAVVTRNQNFNRLLGSILTDWKYVVVDDPVQAKVVFVERGLGLPADHGQLVWLTSMPLPAGYFLTVPISLASLFLLLEGHFFPTPRRHIRITLETAMTMKIDEVWQEGRLVSLSKRGGRFTCAREMPRGMVLDIEVKLAGRLLKLPAEVLYCIPGGDSPGRMLPQVGVLFKTTDQQIFKMLQHFIERACIESACAREHIQPGDPCLYWIERPAEPCESRS